MITLDNMLSLPAEDPDVQWLRTRRDAGEELRVELERDSSPLGSSVVGLIVRAKRDGVDQPPRTYDWDDSLNSSMIELGIRAVDLEQEGDRFARVLRAALRKVERRYGDGYMNAVLIDLIDESKLGKDGEIGKVRRYIHFDAPERGGRSYPVCRETIAIEIGGRARELRDKLDYGPEEIKTVMDRAIARFLDERFSIGAMRRLGWIDENGRTTP